MASVLQEARNQLRPFYWRLRFTLLNASWVRRQALGRKLTGPLPGTKCSICRSSEVWGISFYSEHRIDKCYCMRCRHIFSRNLNRNVERASELFAYHKPSDQYEGQRLLQIELLRHYSGAHGRFLDFGVGGNTGIAADLRHQYPQHEFLAADLYPSKCPFYFQLYARDAPLHSFDGISSNAVVEHLDNTEEAWRYLNTLLKPVAEGGGVMLHAFPSQLVEDLDHWAIKIASHECLFSRESLELLCRRTGFESLRWRYFAQVQHPVHFFRKIRDVA